MYVLDDNGLATLLGLIKQTATSSTAGMMSAADKAKLDGINTSFTANRVLVSNSSGEVAVSVVTETELGYLHGVTSNVQDQLDAKAPSYTYSTTDLTAGSSSLTTGEIYLVYE